MTDLSANDLKKLLAKEPKQVQEDAEKMLRRITQWMKQSPIASEFAISITVHPGNTER